MGHCTYQREVTLAIKGKSSFLLMVVVRDTVGNKHLEGEMFWYFDGKKSIG